MCLTNAHESELFYLEVGVWLTFAGGHFFALLAGAEYLTDVKSTSGIHSSVLSFMPKLIEKTLCSLFMKEHYDGDRIQSFRRQR